MNKEEKNREYKSAFGSPNSEVRIEHASARKLFLESESQSE
jgi:hypothetical protein